MKCVNQYFVLAIAITATIGIASADDHIKGPSVTKCYKESVHDLLTEGYHKLPAMDDLCKKLGIEKANCDEKHPFFFNVRGETDKSLWYGGTSASTDDSPGGRCYGAIPIETYYTMDGSPGTVYACKVEPKDDHITEDEIRAVTQYAQHLNSIGLKTLADHEAALGVKQWAKSITQGTR